MPLKISLTHAQAAPVAVELDNTLIFETVDGEERTIVCKADEATLRFDDIVRGYLEDGYRVDDADRDAYAGFAARIGEARARHDARLVFPPALAHLEAATREEAEARLLANVPDLPSVAANVLDYIGDASRFVQRGPARQIAAYAETRFVTVHRLGLTHEADAVLPFLEIGRSGADTLYLDLLNGSVFAVHPDDWVDLLDGAEPIVARVSRIAIARDRGLLEPAAK